MATAMNAYLFKDVLMHPPLHSHEVRTWHEEKPTPPRAFTDGKFSICTGHSPLYEAT